MADGAEQMTFDASRLDADGVGNLARRPALDVAQHEHLALAWRQLLEGAPDATLLVHADDLAFRRAPARGGGLLVEHRRGRPPAAPPARPAPDPAGVDGDARQPRPPRHVRVVRSLRCPEQLHEHLLTNVLGLVRIAQEEPAEAQHPGPVNAVEVVVRRPVRFHTRTLRHAQAWRHGGASDTSLVAGGLTLIKRNRAAVG